MHIESRFDIRLPYYLAMAVVSSFLLSFFLLQLFTGLLVLAWLFESNKNKFKALDTISYIFIAFVLIRILSALFSNYPDSSNQIYYKDSLFFLSFFAFVYYLKVFDENKLRTIYFAVVIAAICVACIGLTKFLTGSVERAQSFTSGYSTFSSYLVSLIGFALILFRLIKAKQQKLLLAAGIVLMLSGIVTSLGRTNIVIAILIFITGIVAIKIKARYAITLLILAIGISWISFQLNVKEINQRIEIPVQLSDRDILLETAMELFMKFEKPIVGYGPRTFHNVFTNREQLSDKGVGSWHNDFIQVYFESGFLGLAAFFVIIFFPLIKALKCLKDCRLSEDRKYILMGAVLGLVGLVLSALTAGFINSPILSILFAFFITTISVIVYPVKNNQVNNP
ncbi:MAG: O-antigen ligase family protein [Ignavibacteriaceae bacterium]